MSPPPALGGTLELPGFNVARRQEAVAIKAVAHKLARACYHMLHEGTTFDLTRAFG